LRRSARPLWRLFWKPNSALLEGSPTSLPFTHPFFVSTVQNHFSLRQASLGRYGPLFFGSLGVFFFVVFFFFLFSVLGGTGRQTIFFWLEPVGVRKKPSYPPFLAPLHPLFCPFLGLFHTDPHHPRPTPPPRAPKPFPQFPNPPRAVESAGVSPSGLGFLLFFAPCTRRCGKSAPGSFLRGVSQSCRA